MKTHVWSLGRISKIIQRVVGLDCLVTILSVTFRREYFLCWKTPVMVLIMLVLYRFIIEVVKLCSYLVRRNSCDMIEYVSINVKFSELCISYFRGNLCRFCSCGGFAIGVPVSCTGSGVVWTDMLSLFQCWWCQIWWGIGS